MIKNRTIIEVEVNGREYRLECCSESPLQDVSQAITVMGSYVYQRIKEIDLASEEAKPKDEQNVDQH